MASFAATSIDIDFTASGYIVGPGSPAGQNGWVASGARFDNALVDNADFAAAGLGAGRSLRVSNGANVAGNPFLRSPQIEQAGEPGLALAVGNTFTAEYTITSATGALQEGLLFDVPLDASSRYGGVMNFRHTAAGLEIGSYWVPPDAPDVSNSSWRSEIFATVDPSVPHTIRVRALFLSDAADVVNVWVDDQLVSGCTGLTTWEHYYNVGGIAVTDRTVNELTFRRTSSAPTGTGSGYLSGLPSAPDTQGFGFLFSDISYGVTDSELPSPAHPPSLADTAEDEADLPLVIEPEQVRRGESIEFSANGFQPNEDVAVVRYPEAVIAEWVTADGSGRVAAELAITGEALEGDHQLQLTGSASGCTAVAPFEVVADATPTPGPGPDPTPGDGTGTLPDGELPATGTAAEVPLLISVMLLMAGIVLVAIASRLRKH